VTGGAVIRAASAGAARRLVPTLVIFLVVTAGAAAGLLGLTLATDANGQFLGAFGAQHGADLAVTVDSAKVTEADLARTAHLPGVTHAAGPYPETAVFASSGSTARTTTPGTHTFTPHSSQPGGSPAGVPQLPTNPLVATPATGLAVVGRASPSGPLDDIKLTAGRWATRPGEIDLEPQDALEIGVGSITIGEKVTVISAPGQPTLTVVGLASSVAMDEQGWVAPGQLAALTPKKAPAQEQMLYDFASAATPAQIGADLAEITRALPAGAVTDSISWLDVAGHIASEESVNTPFVVTFGIIALVLAVLITANVVSAAVIAAYRRIGVLKSIGFTPLQVTATYLTQIGVPALAGAVVGTLLGDHWVFPLLNGGPFRAQPVPLWIDITVPLGMLALTGLAALVPAARAGRLSATQAIAAGQAPPAGHGFSVHRLAGRIRLPKGSRPVTIGLAAPFTRPARSAVTLAAVTFGLTAVVLVTGLYASLAKINSGADLWQNAELVHVGNPATTQPLTQPLTQAQRNAVTAALRAQPGTVAYLAIAAGQASVPGVGSHVKITAYSGDAAGLGWDLTAGTWYTGPGQVVVNTAEPGTATLSVGQIIKMTVGGRAATARVVGEAYAPGPVLGALLTSQQTFTDAGINLPIVGYEAATTASTNQNTYQAALERALGPGYDVTQVGVGPNGGVGRFAQVDTSLARLLSIMVAVLAALGVLNSVLMLARERVHDLGVFKAVGMTPRQTVAMVACWAVAPAIGAAIIGLPAGMRLQAVVIHTIGNGTGGLLDINTTPGGVVQVYTAGGLALLALAGLALAIAGALGPAIWAAFSRPTTALRAE
jgi:putative ABC transport system permease protein